MHVCMCVYTGVCRYIYIYMYIYISLNPKPSVSLQRLIGFGSWSFGCARVKKVCSNISEAAGVDKPVASKEFRV